MSEEPRFQVDVEPLSDARWERLEQRVLAARSRDGDDERTLLVRRRWPTVAWAGGAALVAAVLAIVATRALVRTPAAPAAAPIAVVAGAGGATLTVADATITSSPGARFVVVRTADAGVRVELDRGDVACEVAPRGARAPFRVQAGDVDVEVVGTAFTVRRPDGGEVAVEVTHGTVRVGRAGARVAVTAGQAWRDGAVLAFQSGGLRPLVGRSPTSLPAIDTGTTAGTDAGAGALATTGTGATAATGPATPGTATTVGAVSDASGPEGTTPTPLADAEARRQLDRAEAIEAREPEAARRVYERLVTEAPRGIAARARYSLAFLDFRAGERLERAGDRDRARAAFESALRHATRYQRQFPAGKNAPEVLRLEILSYYHLDDPRRREAARRYLDRFPTGDFAEKARQIANWQ